MKKLLFILLLTASLHAETFGYGDFQTMWGFPMAGLGVRIKKESHALDFSGNLCVWAPHFYHVKALYIAYPNTYGLYLGGGVGAMNISRYFRDLTGTFEGALGYQWDATRHYIIFLEANAIFPFRPASEPDWARLWPSLTFGVGF